MQIYKNCAKQDTREGKKCEKADDNLIYKKERTR